MPGYDPNCPNCHRCSSCNGNGSLMVTKYGDGEKGRNIRYQEQESCSSCGGRGGRVGVGEHKHA
jgi:hypothetical protein